MSRLPALLVVGMLLLPVSGMAQSPLKFDLDHLESLIRVQEAEARALESLAKRNVSHHLEWKGWWQKVEEVVGASQDAFVENLEARKKGLQKLKALVDGLEAGGSEKVWIGKHRWVDPAAATDLLKATAKEASEFKKLVQDGKDRWWIVALRWVTSGRIQEEIDAQDEAVREIEASVKDGSFGAHFARQRKKTLSMVRGRIAELEDTIEAKKKAFAEGTYDIHVPGFTVLDRNSLDMRIAAAEEAIELWQGKFDAKEYGLARVVYPSFLTEAQLDELLAKHEASFKAMEDTVGKGLYQVWFKDDGNQTRTGFEKMLEELDAKAAEIQEKVAAGEYEAWAFGVQGTRVHLREVLKKAEEKLALPKLRKGVRESLEKRVKSVRKLLAAIPQISAYELARLGLEKAQVTRNLALVMKLAKPDFEKRKLTRDQWTGWRDEFSHSLEVDLAPLKHHLEYLQTIRQTYFTQ